MIAKKNLVLTHDRMHVVEEGDPDGNSGFRFALKGEEIPEEAAERFGLKEGALCGKGATAAKPAKAQAKPSEDEEL